MVKILIVEDEEILLNLLVAGLSDAGFETITATDGVTALKMARVHTPILIVSDMGLPKMTGWELVKAVREDASIKNIPIIALTGHDTAVDRDEAHAAGITAFESKPVDIGRLKTAIVTILGG